MTDDQEILPSEDDDDFGEGVVSSGQIVMPEVPEPSALADYSGDIYSDDGTYPELNPDSESVITPPDQYDRKNAVVAPDGSPLTDNQIAKPHLWRAGDERTKQHRPKKANRVNVREIVNKLASKQMLDPIEVLFYIMNANEESRAHLGLKKSDRISANLRAKCAQELLNYMASKLKSVEVKVKGDDGKGTGVQIFLPGNTREQGKIAEQPTIVLPEKDGVTIPFSPEIAHQLIVDDEEETPDWAEGEE